MGSRATRQAGRRPAGTLTASAASAAAGSDFHAKWKSRSQPSWTVKFTRTQSSDNTAPIRSPPTQPTAPTPAFRIGEKADDPLQMYLSDIFTISVNLAGIPALSMPCGLTRAGLPIGLQLLGKPFDEATLLRAAYAYEQATEWHKKRAVVR